MNDTPDSIHNFDLDLICEYFAHFERQGPGSPEATRAALRFVDGLDASSRIADLGCGTGGQTRELARHASGGITGVDLFPAFIDMFNRKAAETGLQDRVEGVVGDMGAPPFEEGSLDLIWSEGAIYNIGFEAGLQTWRKYLAPGGHVTVSEACWFTDSRPPEIDAFWNDAYPGIDTIPNKLAQLQGAGYLPVACFILPETCWTDHFYTPQEPVMKSYLQERADDPAAMAFIQAQQHEADLYAKYHAYYGYAFFIGKKVN